MGVGSGATEKTRERPLRTTGRQCELSGEKKRDCRSQREVRLRKLKHIPFLSLQQREDCCYTGQQSQ